MNKRNKLIATFGIIIALSGCAQKVKVSPPIAKKPLVYGLEEQYEQLSSVIAVATYLRNHCNRSDLGGEKNIYDNMLHIASAKGWDVNEIDKMKLSHLSADLYRSLSSNKSLESHCNQLNREMAGVLHVYYNQ